MNRAIILTVVMCLLSPCVFALTGAGDSANGALETVSPSLDSVSAVTERSLSATFSEPMLLPGVTAPGNYAVSGLGVGTLSANPAGVSGSGPYALTWTAGEMQNGSTVTVTATGLQDALGNPIAPAHNSASSTGMGVPPSLSDLIVTPSQASCGETVTIAFTASETLAANPVVTVNGHAATFAGGGKSVAYTYTYVILETDAIGMASIAISGNDLAGNPGSLSSSAALAIVESLAPLPLYAWPLLAGLMLAGIAVFAQKKWGLTQAKRSGDVSVPVFWFLLVAALMATSPAFAASPSVTNVTFTQSPNASSTQVDIYYDLVAPNGPCAITLSLSKNGGADGFIHPMTHYTGDIANVTTGTGKHIVWDIRADYAEEDIPNARIRVTADDALVQHTLTYTAGANGSISGTSPQTVNHGGNGTAVTAVADPHYHFVQWSDLSTQNPRTDTNVTADISVTAAFAIDTFTLTFTAGAGGSITGTSPQTVNYGGSGTAVTAVPDPHCHFVQWSDSVLTAARTDTNVTANISVTASFALDRYDVNCSAVGNGTCTADPASVEYGFTSNITVTPALGWHIMDVVDSEEGAKPGSYTTTPVTANRTVTATFAINTYDITCEAEGDGTCVADPATVEHGSTSDITVTPAVGWRCVRVIDSEEGWMMPGHSYTTTPVTANREIRATFHYITCYITCNVIGSGTCEADPPNVLYGDTSDITVTPAVGWHIVSVVDSEEGAKPGSYTTTPMTADRTVTATFEEDPLPPVVTSFAINSGAATTMPLAVTLNNTCTNSPTDYMASESASFTGAVWQPYATGPSFTLSFGVGVRTVYFKARNGIGESGVVSDTIFVVPNTVSVAAGTFTMGRLTTPGSDDQTYGSTSEDPQHSVTLGAYELGKYDLTNKEYCDVLNWAKAQGYLYSDAAGTPWAGSGNIYAGGTATSRYLAVSFASTDCNIQYSGGVFTSKTRVGLPGTTNYSMDTHPMVRVSWYGSVAFCNWLSQWQGLTPCYDMNTALWPLTVAPPTPGGYRLPTEAEWERAAAWDGVKHWIYGFMSDTLTGKNRANYYDSAPNYVNPLGLTTTPYTSPVGWFNGTNISPNGSVATVDSPSPVGAYDMSGNVYQWVQDWYLSTYYSGGSMTNPTGPGSGTYRVSRGGGWGDGFYGCRSAFRSNAAPAGAGSNLGFRLSRS